MLRPRTLFSDIRETHALWILFLVAFLVRLVGVHYGYDYPDERVNYSAKALSGQLVPDQHFYPPFLYYITAAAFAVLYIIGRLIPVWYSLGEFRDVYFEDPEVFVITARVVVCLISAAIAPLFFAIARELGLRKKYALIPGLFAVFIPVMVLHSHFSKVDVPLAVATCLMFYVALKRIAVVESRRLDIAFGVACALTVSFKHSAVFTTVPFGLLFYGVFFYANRNVASTARSIGLSAAAAIVSWVVFNIGIVLDLSNFLDFQRVQAVMSLRPDDSFASSVQKWWSVVSHLSVGVNPGIVILFLLFPVFMGRFFDLGIKKWVVLAFWVSIVISTLWIISIAGQRQIESLWLPHVTAMQLFASVLIAGALMALHGTQKRLVAGLTGIVALMSVYGTGVVMQQAVARPVSVDLQAFIESEGYQAESVSILTNFPMPYPQSLEGKLADLQRDEDLAQKYGIGLLDKSDEFFEDTTGALNYRVMPVVYAGLEYTDDETLGSAMKPGLWPLQEEEWALDYWLDRGVGVIIYSNFYNELVSREMAEMRVFLAEVEERCARTFHIEPVKPLYVEYSATVFDCRGI